MYPKTLVHSDRAILKLLQELPCLLDTMGVDITPKANVSPAPIDVGQRDEGDDRQMDRG